MGKPAEGLKKGAWTAEEDQKLKSYIQKHGEGGWRSLPEKAGIQRSGKSCRLRWANYLRPGIKRGDFTFEEDQTIIQFHAALGNRWAAIARHLPNRTDNEIKNYWHAHLKKRLADSVGTKPGSSPGSSSGNSSSICDEEPPMADTESERKQESEPTLQQQKTRSSSAQLLNKLASRVTALQCVYPLIAYQSMQSMSSKGTADPITPPPSSLDLCDVAYDALSILDDDASAPARSFSSNSAPALNSMGCIDEWQNNHGGDTETTTTGDVALCLSGDTNIDDTMYQMVGSPIFYDLSNVENELDKPSDVFYIP